MKKVKKNYLNFARGLKKKSENILASIFGRVLKSFVFKNSKSDDESKSSTLLNNVTKIG